jgi:8-oxo-dGTP pyrophosphatase MutT (NUDIX family)
MIVVTVKSPENMMESFTSFMNTGDNNTLVFKGDVDSRKLFADFISFFRYLEASGGMVRNSNNERLYIYRFGKWDLPKGKIEKNETPEIAALREVTEETGLSGQRIISELPSTYHIYEHKGRMVFKKTFWYVMEYSGTEKPVPQTEESITDIRWFGQKDMEAVLKNTYASLCGLIEADAQYLLPAT